jgi:hypothetical protein
MNTKIEEMLKTINDNLPALQAGASLSQVRSASFEARLQAKIQADNNIGHVIGEKSIIDPWALNFYR